MFRPSVVVHPDEPTETPEGEQSVAVLVALTNLMHSVGYAQANGRLWMTRPVQVESPGRPGKVSTGLHQRHRTATGSARAACSSRKQPSPSGVGSAWQISSVDTRRHAR
jgi:hypothetical protein